MTSMEAANMLSSFQFISWFLFLYYYIRTRRYVHAYVHTYVGTYVYTYICTYVHMYTPMQKGTHIYTHAHSYTHTYIHIYIYMNSFIAKRNISILIIFRKSSFFKIKWTKNNNFFVYLDTLHTNSLNNDIWNLAFLALEIKWPYFIENSKVVRYGIQVSTG